jgi:iron complex transport system substrate-binding protein
MGRAGSPCAKSKLTLSDNTLPLFSTRHALKLFAYWLVLPALVLAQMIPQRIVSTAPSITEILFALGEGRQVVGVSNFCAYPPEVTKLPRVGTYLQPDAEAIVRLRPDLVVLEKISGQLTNRLSALHIRYVEVPEGGLDDVYAAIRIIGDAARANDRASDLIKRMQETFSHMQSRAAGMPHPRALLIIGRTPGTLSDLIAVGPGNYLDDLVQLAGGRNVLEKAGLPSYPRISLETVLRENPDIIIDLTGMEESEAQRTKERAETLALWEKYGDLSAVRRHRIYPVASNAFVVPGPRAIEAAETLWQYFHGSRDGK